MYASSWIFCWIWYSVLKKGSAVYELTVTRRNPPLPIFTFMTQYSISFIFDFKENHSQTAGPGKKPTVMSMPRKNWNFRTYFKKALLPSKIPDYAHARQPKLFRDICEVFCDSNSFRKSLKQQQKMFR